MACGWGTITSLCIDILKGVARAVRKGLRTDLVEGLELGKAYFR